VPESVDVAIGLNAPAGAEQLSGKHNFREALELAEKVGREELVGWDCACPAKAMVQPGCQAKGLPYARRAVQILEKLHAPDLEQARAMLTECEAGCNE
jgi:hypothetical protein